MSPKKQISKKKHQSSKQVKKSSPAINVAVESPIVIKTPQLHNFELWNKILIPLCLILGFLFKWLSYPNVSMVLFSVAIFILLSSFLKNAMHLRPLVFIVVGWILVTLSMGTYHNFSYAYSMFPSFHLSSPVLYFVIGFGLMAGFWRYLPLSQENQDISKIWARIGFWIVFGVAAFLRLYKCHESVGNYWDDSATGILDPRGVLEFRDYHMFFPIGTREPFFSYFLAAVWAFIPDAYAIFVQRLGSALIDLCSVWLFYLLGKEVGGRRAGLVAAGMAAVSKPMLISNLLCFTQVTVPMAVALVLLMTFRLFKKSDWNHFIKWGLALGFMPYNYTAVRPFLPFIVTIVFSWIWFYKLESRKKRDFLLGWGTLIVWIYLFLHCNNFLPANNPIIVFLNRDLILGIILVVLILLFIRSIMIRNSENEPKMFPRFFGGVLLAALIIFPLASNPLIYHHMSGLSIFHDRQREAFHPSQETWNMLSQKVGTTLTTVFAHGEDRNDSNLPDDAFLDYHFIPIFILGLISLLVQPTWIKILLFFSIWVGFSPHLLSVDPHTGKLMGAIAPMAALSAIGLQQVYSTFKASTSKHYHFIGGFILLVYLGWAAYGSFDQVWLQFFKRQFPDKTVSVQVAQYAPRDKVYLALWSGYISTITQAVLDQGYDVNILGTHNPIFIKPGEIPRDVVVLMSVFDTVTKATIENQYKNVSWEIISRAGIEAEQEICRRAIIPSAEISDVPGKLFYIQKVPSQNWTRDYLMDRTILGYGLIEMEESVPDPYNPVPQGMDGRFVNLKGNFNLSVPGRVRFEAKSANYIRLLIDGHKVLYLKPDNNYVIASGQMDVSAGTHQVVYNTFLIQRDFSKILMSFNGGPEKALGE